MTETSTTRRIPTRRIPTRRRALRAAPAALLAAALLVSGGASSAVAAPPPADPFPVDESFAGAFADPAWTLPNPAQNVTTLLPDALRLTSANVGGPGNATLAQSFPSDVSWSATFDYQAFGGGNPGDGFTFFLMDGAQAPSLGGSGGSLGYANMQGAYVAVGFDNYGNFSTDGPPPFAAPMPSSLVLRGASNATGTGPFWPVLARTPTAVQTDGITPRTVTIEVEPSGADSILLTVVVGGTTLFDAVDVRTIAPAGDADAGIPTRLQPARPATFAFGFSAGTGGATNNYDISNLVATAATNLAVVKTGPASIEPGTSGTWNIAVSNDDTNAVTGATLTDAGLPADMTDLTWTCVAVDGACPAPSGSGAGPWSLDLARNGTATFVVTGTVPDAAAGTTIANTATIAAPADRTESDPSDNTSTSQTVVPAFPDLATSAALSSDAPVRFGESATWVIDVENIGAGAAPGASVEIVLPATIDPTTVAPPAGCTSAGRVLTCALGDLAAGDAESVSVTGTVDGETAACASGPAVLTATAATTRRELDTANNTATVDTPCVFDVDLAAAKTSNGPVTVGSDVVWTIVVTNAAPGPAPATAIRDALPAGAAWTCTVSGAGACSTASGAGSIDVTADLDGGGSATVIARVPTTEAGTLANTVTIAPCPTCVDAGSADDSATATAEVRARGGLPTTGGVVPGSLLGLGLVLFAAGAVALGLRPRRR